MLNDLVQDGINKQINDEMYASYLYLSMSAYCEHVQFTGCARWLRMQSEEEYGHAMKLYDFLVARQGKVTLQAIAAPPTDFASLAAVFDDVLTHEQSVTRSIDSLYELAFKEKAFSTLIELEWFVTEQVEEEKSAREIVHKFSLVKDEPASLLELDRELGQRTGGGEPAASA